MVIVQNACLILRMAIKVLAMSAMFWVTSSLIGSGIDSQPNKPMNKSGIHIKESHKGRFTAVKKKTGKTTAELKYDFLPLLFSFLFKSKLPRLFVDIPLGANTNTETRNDDANVTIYNYHYD